MQQTQSEKSYQAILQQIHTGSLAPGMQLVTRTLAAEIGVSLSPVREAINRLATEGLIEHTPGAGAVVRQLSLEDLDELYVLREAIESCAAGLAAELMTSRDLEDLEDLVEAQQDIATDLKGSVRGKATSRQLKNWLSLEEQFHDSVVRLARNRLLAKVIRDHRTISRVFESHALDPSILNAAVAEETVKGKKQLLAAFKKRNSDKASDLMSSQINRGRRNVMRQLKRQQTS